MTKPLCLAVHPEFDAVCDRPEHSEAAPHHSKPLGISWEGDRRAERANRPGDQPAELDHLTDAVWDELEDATNRATEPYTYEHVKAALSATVAPALADKDAEIDRANAKAAEYCRLYQAATDARDEMRGVADAAVGLLERVLGHFHDKGHPDEYAPCRRTGWINEPTLAEWTAWVRSWRAEIHRPYEVVDDEPPPDWERDLLERQAGHKRHRGPHPDCPFCTPVARVWQTGDPMPAHGTRVRTADGAQVLVRILGGDLWRDEDDASSFGTWPIWLTMAGPLTEVLEGGDSQ